MLNTLVKKLPAVWPRPLTPRMLNFVRIRQSMLEASVRSAGLREQHIDLGNEHVHVWEGGRRDKPTLVFLHGFGATAVWQWYSQIEMLARHYRIVMPNLLWFGNSTSDTLDFSIDHQAQMVSALLTHLGARRFHLCGLSYGGTVAALLSSLEPERVLSLTLASSPAHAYTRDDHKGLCRRFRTDDITRVFVPDSIEGVQRLLDIGYKRPPLAPRFAMRQVLELMYTDTRDEKRSLIRCLVDDMDRLKSAAQGYEGPTQLIWGKEDPVFPLEIAHRLLDLVGDAHLAVIDETRHAPNLECADEFNHVLGGFLESVST